MTRIASARGAAADPTGEPDLVTVYLDEIGRIPTLSRDEEIALARAIEAGRNDPGGDGPVRLDPVAADAHRTMVTANLRLVVFVAKRARRPGSDLLDRIQDGNCGLILAVDRYDWRKGFRFSTYAIWWIRQAIEQRAHTVGRNIRLPDHVRLAASAIRSAESTLLGALGRPATPAEIGELVGLSPARVVAVLEADAGQRSLSDPQLPGADHDLGETIADPVAERAFTVVEDDACRHEVRRLLDRLDAREASVIRLRFGLEDGTPRTLEEIGRMYDVTRERIRQVETRAFGKLRRLAAQSAVREFLDAP